MRTKKARSLVLLAVIGSQLVLGVTIPAILFGWESAVLVAAKYGMLALVIGFLGVAALQVLVEVDKWVQEGED